MKHDPVKVLAAANSPNGPVYANVQVLAVRLIDKNRAKVSFTVLERKNPKYGKYTVDAQRAGSGARANYSCYSPSGAFSVYDGMVSNALAELQANADVKQLGAILAQAAEDAFADPKAVERMRKATDRNRQKQLEQERQAAWSGLRHSLGLLYKLGIPSEEIEQAVHEELARSIMEG